MNRISKVTKLFLSTTFATISILCASCAHYDFKDYLEKHQCEMAAQKLPLTESSSNLLLKGKQFIGHVGSYTATGAGYVVDTVILVGEGAITGVAVCLPIKLVASKIGIQGPIDELCQRITGNLMVGYYENHNSIGKQVFTSTKDWRCADFNLLGQSIREISKCFFERKQSGDIEKAQVQLDAIIANKIFFECLSISEQEEIRKSLHQYRQSGNL